MSKFDTRKTKEQIRRETGYVSTPEKIVWVKKQFEEDPKMSINGSGGISDRMMTVFGHAFRGDMLKGLKADALNELRRKKEKEMQEQKQKNGSPPPALFNPVLKPADLNQLNSPGGTRSMDDMKIRYQYVYEFMRRNPRARNREIDQSMRDKFGISVDRYFFTECRRRLGLSHRYTKQMLDPNSATTRKLRNAKAIADWALLGAIRPPDDADAAPAPTAARAPTADRAPAIEMTEVRAKPRKQTPADVIKTAVQLLLSEVPELQSLSLVIERQNGKPVPKVTFVLTPQEDQIDFS